MALQKIGAAGKKLNEAISNCNGTAEKMAATMQDNLAGQLTILKSQLEELAISIGEILMPSIRQIVGWIQGMKFFFIYLSEHTYPFWGGGSS